MIENNLNIYIDQDEKDKITIEGAMELCQDLGIEPTQFEFLIMSHQLGSERMGEFQRKAFVQGMVRLQCNTIQELKEELPQLMKLLDDPEQFRAIYNYAFILGREQGQKSLCKSITLLLLTSDSKLHILSSGSCHWALATIAQQPLYNVGGLDHLFRSKNGL